MAIAVTCGCGRSLQIKDEFAGRKVRCPGCKGVLTVPKSDAEDDAAAALLAEDEDHADRREPAAAAWRGGEEEAEDRPGEKERSRRASVQSEEPDPPVRRRRPEKVKADKPKKRSIRRDDERSGPRVAFEPGWFGSLNAGAVGGLLMVVIAIAWFVVGLANGIIFFYPPVLLVIGLGAIFKGLSGGD